MTESGAYPGNGPEFDSNPPASPIEAYLAYSGQPALEDVKKAAEVIEEHRKVERTGDVLSICVDLAIAVPNATAVLADMISASHEVVPKRWVSDPEETRMAISITGRIEAAYLRAQQEIVRRGAGFPELSERADEIDHLVEALHSQRV